jgi:hypothetical protein
MQFYYKMGRWITRYKILLHISAHNQSEHTALMILISLLWVSPHWAVLLASQLVRPSEWWGQHVRQTVVAVSATVFLQLIMESHRHHYMQHYHITRMHISRSHLITVDAKRVTWNKFHTEDQQTLGARSFSSLSYDRSKASSKASPLHSAI